MKIQGFWWSLAWMSVVLGAGPLTAGRTLDEPKAILARKNQANAPATKAALEAAGMTERCPPEVFRSPDVRGMGCRLALHRQESARLPLTTAADLARRLQATQDALDASSRLASFAPLSPPPGLAEHRFIGQRLACQIVVDTYDALNALPAKTAPALVTKVQAALARFPANAETGLHEAACRCTEKSLTLGAEAGASLEELGGLQQTFTGRSCGLDKDKVKTERGGPATEFSGAAKEAVAETTVETRLLEYARSRDVTLERCRAKHINEGQIKDADKLTQCACSEVARWPAFPKEKGRADVRIRLPLVADTHILPLTVHANGKTSACGPLEGAGQP